MESDSKFQDSEGFFSVSPREGINIQGEEPEPQGEDYFWLGEFLLSLVLHCLSMKQLLKVQQGSVPDLTDTTTFH